MDTTTFELLIQKLQDLLAKEAITAHPSFVKEVQKALQSLEQNQSLQDSEDQYQVSSVIPAVIIDSLLKRKEFQLQPSRKGEIDGFKKVVQYPFTCFKASHSQDLFTLQMKKLLNEIDALSCSHAHLVENRNDGTSSYFLNEDGRQRQKQLWERNFKNYLEEENYFVGQQRDENPLKITSNTKKKRNGGIPPTHDQSSKGTEKNPAQQDGDQSNTQVNSEAGTQDCETNGVGLEQTIKNIPAAQEGDPSTKVDENGKTVNNHSDFIGDEVPEETDDHGDETDESSYESEEEAIYGNSACKVVAVIGEAGSGKSTLLRTVYNRFVMKRHFTERVWVRVSSESKARDVLLSIVKQTKEFVEKHFPKHSQMGETLSEKQLILILKKSLKDRNYLIVIEDVETPQVWRVVRDALNYHPSRNNSSGRYGKVHHGGSIIITSRKDNATLGADSTIRMRPLNKEESWELFLKKVQFAEDEAVKSFQEEILKLCHCLPLGIVLLGGLLSTKEVTDWLRVIESAKKSTGGDRLALLCYQDLPSEIKPCFLYMALFPKEYEIPVRRLIHLWCAEGFVTTSNSEEMVLEDRAELYFQELVIRNMVQVRWRLDGNPATCRMHDHLHDIFSQRAVDEGFFYLDPPQSSDTTVKQTKPEVRRLASAYHGDNNFPSSSIDLANLRSSFVFDTRVQGTPAKEVGPFLNKIIGNRDFGLLKVLDLEGVYKPDLSNAVEKLKLLSYLGLRSTFIHSLPESNGNLSYLETLDLKHTKIRNLPSSIWKAKKMQHLYLNCVHSEIVSSSFSDSLPNLRTLWGLCIKDDSDGHCDFLHKLTRLRKLGLTCPSTSSLKIIGQLTELQSLKLKCLEEDSGSLQLQSMKKNEKLREVYLMGKLETSVKNDVSFFPCSLRVLTLCGSGLEEDSMRVLGQLKELKILRLLKGSFNAWKLRWCDGEFPELHVLKLWHLHIQGGCKVQRGAMPRLRLLEIGECDINHEQFTGLEHLTTLKEVVLKGRRVNEIKQRLKKLKTTNVICID